MFSKPVIAKNDSDTPPRIASTGLPSVANSVSVPKWALPSPMYRIAQSMMIARPAISTKVISMLTTTDWVMPMKLTTVRTARNASTTTSVGGEGNSSAKYVAKPLASDPAAAKLAERNEIVTRNVRALLPNALLT